MTSIEEAFGVAVRFKDSIIPGKRQILPPPPAVLRVLGDLAHREALQAPGHGPKTQKRRSKRRRLRRRERVLQRTTWRAFHEEEKRRAAG